MTEHAAELTWLVLAAYLGLGALVGAMVLLFGLGRLEPNAASMPLRVRALILPGLAALWPLILLRLLGSRAREDKP